MTTAPPTTRSRRANGDPAALPPRWPWLFRLFRSYARRYAAKHLHAIRVSQDGPPPVAAEGPEIVALNHPSWWDPIVCFVLSDLFPRNVHWGVMDEAGFRQYPFLARAGLFGVETGSASGAARFLRTAGAILANPKAMLWITAQGRFADVRDRPLRLRSGVGHLAATLDRGSILPMAVELTFWNERTPEALVRFGKPFAIAAHPDRSAAEWTATIERELERTQDNLAVAARSRDAALFDTVIRGRAGVGGVYDGWRRVRARLRGERFRPEHSPDKGA